MSLTNIFLGFIAVAITLLFSATATNFFQRRSALKIAASGHIVAAGSGSIVIEEHLPMFSGMLENPDRYFNVEFDPHEAPRPPCAGGDEEDTVEWELVFKHRHKKYDQKPGADTLQLKISWRVSSVRSIIWRTFEPAKSGSN
jgi:hypothetical protein